MDTIVDVVEVKLGDRTFYGIFTGWGNVCICDAWIMEESDIELLLGEETYRSLWSPNVHGIAGDFVGVFLTEDREKAEKIASLIRERYPQGFCLGCERKLALMKKLKEREKKIKCNKVDCFYNDKSMGHYGYCDRRELSIGEGANCLNYSPQS